MGNATLAGQRALITGGGSGIGLGCARALHADGATVTLMGRSEERLQAAAASLGGERVRIAVGDVGREADVLSAVRIASDDGDGLDIAVASAGTGTVAPVIAQSLDDFRRVMNTNLEGTFLTLKHAGAVIARTGGGALCTISSIAGIRTHRHGGTYCASKAAIDMLVRNFADELGFRGVRCNSVLPGLVATDLSQGLQDDDAMRREYLDLMPVSRVGEVEDIANAVRFLCGPESSWITGVSLSVDGGQHLRSGPDWTPFGRALLGDAAADGDVDHLSAGT